MPKLLVIDDRDQTIEMCHRHLPQFDYVTRCGRPHPCQVCEERDKGCPLKCAHNYYEAAQALGREGTLPDLVVLDLHFALPANRLLPEEKDDLKLEQVRRKQGLFILERLRRDYPTLPVVMLTTTEGDPALLPQDPLVHFCENEVVDSRTLASEISRALTLHHAAQEGPVFWGRSPAMAELRRQIAVLARSPLPVLIQGETGTGKSFLAEHVLHPRSGAKGPLVITDLSTVPDTLMPAHLIGFAVLESLRSQALRPLLRAYLARFPTPQDYQEENSTVTFGKPQAKSARRDAFSIFFSQATLSRLTAHPWPGNHRELRLLCTNALV